MHVPTRSGRVLCYMEPMEDCKMHIELFDGTVTIEDQERIMGARIEYTKIDGFICSNIRHFQCHPGEYVVEVR